MFIRIAYKDAPEITAIPRRTSSESIDSSVEKTMIVNPKCPIRILLEYIRNKCGLGKHTEFDLCDENGYLKGLFGVPTYVYVTEQFIHKNTYYVVVIKQDGDRKISVLPQLNRANIFYNELKQKIKKFLESTDASPKLTLSPVGGATPSPALPLRSLLQPKGTAKKKQN